MLSGELDDDPLWSPFVGEWGGISKSDLESVCTLSCLGCWTVPRSVGALKAPAGVWSCFSGACCGGGLIRLTAQTFSDSCASDNWRAFHLWTQLPVRDACSSVTGRRFNYQRPELNHHKTPALDSRGSFPKLTNWLALHWQPEISNAFWGLANRKHCKHNKMENLGNEREVEFVEIWATHKLRGLRKPLFHLWEHSVTDANVSLSLSRWNLSCKGLNHSPGDCWLVAALDHCPRYYWFKGWSAIDLGLKLYHLYTDDFK